MRTNGMKRPKFLPANSATTIYARSASSSPSRAPRMTKSSYSKWIRRTQSSPSPALHGRLFGSCELRSGPDASHNYLLSHIQTPASMMLTQCSNDMMMRSCAHENPARCRRSPLQAEPAAGAGGVEVEPPQQTPKRLSFAPLAAPVLIGTNSEWGSLV